MTKKAFSACALLVASTTAAYAGTMGDTKPLPLLIPFFAGEGMYTWPDIDGFRIGVDNVGTFTSKQDKQGWGGRLAAGAIHPLTETWAGSAEIGWGYYGSVDMNPSIALNPNTTVTVNTNAFKVKMDQYGFDILAGLFYTQPQYDLFFKVGALIQNLRVKASLSPDGLGGNGTSGISARLGGNYTASTILVNALPELKLGGGYHINQNWLATLSWMHAFGSSLNINAPSIKNSPASIGSVSAQITSPTLNTILFGLEYRFS
ncbi:MAG: hypothetical protein P1U61_06225 [Legionellaceae bacterium]|nr:hypothetical protein [Legionellaceae bacterium]